jgi:hypothetical protein
LSGRVCSAIVLLAVLVSCRSGAGTSQGVAERFLDEHYVRMDLVKSSEYCVGVAHDKVMEMRHLVEGQPIDESTRKPRVSYSLEKTTEESPERVSFLYLGTIQPEDLEKFTRHWLVTTRKESDGQWKVSNFQEFE